MKNKGTSDKKGISLIVLVITIIVIIILAVAVILSIANNNPIENAKEARFKNDVRTMQEELEMLKANNYANNNGASYDNSDETKITIGQLQSASKYQDDFEVKDGVLYIKSGNKLTEKEQKWADELGVLKGVEVISKTESKVGCYADIDGDGEADGVIYADLAVGGNVHWGDDKNGYTSFSYAKETDTKDYYVRGSYKGTFSDDEKDLISVVEGAEGKERFYVMALKDINPGTTYCWYDAAYDIGISNYATVTSDSFGAGKANTQTMIEKWNAGEYGAKDAGSKPDMWGAIQEEVKKGWYVPSKEEWAAFGGNLSITSSNYVNKSLSGSYWSSSLSYSKLAWRAYLDGGYMFKRTLISYYYVRLGTTF